VSLQPPVLIEGVRVRLRRATPQDAAALFVLADDSEVMQFMDWPRMQSPEQTRSHLEAVDQRWRAGSEHQWVVQHKISGTLVGTVACRPKDHSADFGYFMGRAHWGQGLGSEAAGLLLGWLQRQQGLLRIWATCDAENARSAAVLRKLGLQQEGLMRRATRRPNLGGATRDTLLFAWVREEVRSSD
jgi:[ribosomal protein S5]-alanine N-acetyltransferase